MALSAVIWRDKYWSVKGSYGYSSGHQNHVHLEFPGTPGRVLRAGQASYDDTVSLGRWLQARGFRVAEHPAFGVVHSVHSGRGHYDHRAIDVNFGPGGANDIERAAFDALIPSVLHQGAVVANVKVPNPPPEDDMPDARYFDLKFAQVRNDVMTLQQEIHDSLAERIAKAVKYIKTGDEKLLKELEALGTYDVPGD